MKIIADMHTHTIASGHAYSTVNELAHAAAQKKLKAIALTDHGPALPGGPHSYHFAAMRFIPTHIAGVRILLGIEANITSVLGTLDLPDYLLTRLDFVMAGLHEGCGMDDKGIDRNTEAVINAMKNPILKAISHPGNPYFPLHYEAIVDEAVRRGTAIEMNNSSFSVSRKGSRPNCERLAHLIANRGAFTVIGSDAHISQGIGIFEDACDVLKRAGVREEQIVNSTVERLQSFLGTTI